MTMVTVSGVMVTVPRPRVVIPVDAALVDVAAAGTSLPEQPASASAPSATTATLHKPRFIAASVHPWVYRRRAGLRKVYKRPALGQRGGNQSWPYSRRRYPSNRGARRR